MQRQVSVEDDGATLFSDYTPVRSWPSPRRRPRWFQVEV